MEFPTPKSVVGVQSTQLLSSLTKQQRDCLGQGQTTSLIEGNTDMVQDKL